MPVYRLELALFDWLFGTNAECWNAVMLLLYALTMWLLALVLRRWQVHPAGAALTLFWFAIGRTSSHLMIGYYCLSIPLLQILSSCLGAFLALDRAMQTGRKIWGWLGFLALAFGGMTDFPGVWIFAAVPVLLFSSSEADFSLRGLSEWLRQQKFFAIAFIVVAALAAACYGAIYASFDRHSLDWLAEMEEHNPRTILGTLSKLFYYFTNGIVIQLLMPVAIAGNWPLLGQILTFLCGVGGVIFLFCLGTPRERRIMLAAIGLLLLFAFEVVIGRPRPIPKLLLVQYVAPAHLWMTIFAAVGLTAFGRALNWRAAGWAAWFGVATVLAAACGIPSGLDYLNRMAKLQQIHIDIRDVGRRLEKLTPAGGEKIRALPTLEFASIRARYPEPSPNIDLSDFVFFLPPSVQAAPLVRNEANLSRMVLFGSAPPINVKLTNSLRTACGPEFIQQLAQTPEALWLYQAPMEMTPLAKALTSVPPLIDIPSSLKVAGPTVAKPDITVQFYSDGTAELSLAETPFDPEKRSLVVFDGIFKGPGRVARIEVRAKGEPFELVTAWLSLTNGQTEPFSFDLNRLPLFALNRKITGVQLRFATPGEYQLKSARF